MQCKLNLYSSPSRQYYSPYFEKEATEAKRKGPCTAYKKHEDSTQEISAQNVFPGFFFLAYKNTSVYVIQP